MTGPTKYPRPWVVRRKPGQRKLDHGARLRAAEWRAYQALWQKRINEISSPTGEAFYNLRRNVLVLNRKQCARLLRVGVQSVLNWETSVHPVPFYAYLALLLISESQHYRLASEAWKDWSFLERLPDDAFQQRKGRRENIITELVNRKLGAAFTPRQLEWYHVLMQQAVATLEANVTLQSRVEALVRENTAIREAFRVGGVTAELHEMRERMEGLLGRINTAKVVPLRKAAVA